MSIQQLLKKWRSGQTTQEEYSELVNTVDCLAISSALCGNMKESRKYAKILKEVLSKGNR